MSAKARRPYFPNSKTKEWSQSWIKLCNLLSLSYDSDPQTIADNMTAGAYYRRMYQRSATTAAPGSTPDTASSSAPTADIPVTAARTEADG